MTSPELTGLATTLGEIAIRNTASVVASRVSGIRARKNDREAVNELIELVNELLDDKTQLVSIARSFEDELVAQRISDEDITYITSELVPVAEKLFAAGGVVDHETQEQIDLIKSVLTPDLLKIMQLVGFNYRRAVGEPLTSLVERLILSNIPAGAADAELQTMQLRRETAYLEAITDPDVRALLRDDSDD